MRVEKDFEDFIELLNAHKVKYLVIGAYAVSFYAQPRNTGDIDFLVRPDPENANKVLKVLNDFGFGSLDISIEMLCEANTVIQLGFEPNRIDLITSIGDVIFDEAYRVKKTGEFGNQKVNFISLKHLIKSKEIANRPQDLADIDRLIKFKKLNRKKSKESTNRRIN